MAITAIDDYGTNIQNLGVPAQHAFTSTGDDTNELSHITRAIFVGGAGNMTVVMKDGATVTLTGIVAGTILPLQVRQIKAAGLTASNIVCFW